MQLQHSALQIGYCNCKMLQIVVNFPEASKDLGDLNLLMLGLQLQELIQLPLAVSDNASCSRHCRIVRLLELLGGVCAGNKVAQH